MDEAAWIYGKIEQQEPQKEVSLSFLERKVVDVLLNDPGLRSEEIREDIKMPSRSVRGVLQKLKNKGVVYDRKWLGDCRINLFYVHENFRGIQCKTTMKK